MVTVRGAKTLQIEERYGLDVGKPASFVLLPVPICHQPWTCPDGDDSCTYGPWGIIMASG